MRKDYLKEKLSKEEDTEILGIIWQTIKKHKIQMYNKKKEKMLNLIDIDECVNDIYTVEKPLLIKFSGVLQPFSDIQKIAIVNKLDELLDDFDLTKLKRTLTFDQKLVFVLIYAENLTKRDTARLLRVRRRTIYNRCKAIEKKIEGKERNNGK